jgi:hypothetical protein
VRLVAALLRLPAGFLMAWLPNPKLSTAAETLPAG